MKSKPKVEEKPIDENANPHPPGSLAFQLFEASQKMKKPPAKQEEVKVEPKQPTAAPVTVKEISGLDTIAEEDEDLRQSVVAPEKKAAV